jgi:two-component system, OmpR family, sensor kinase
LEAHGRVLCAPLVGDDALMTPGSSAMVRRAARRLGLQAGALASGVVVLLSAAAVMITMQGQHDSAVAQLEAAVTRADDIDDPPAWTWLAIRRPGVPGTDIDPQMPAGTLDMAALDRVSAGGPTELTQVDVGGVDYLVETLRQPDHWVVQGVLDLAPNEVARDRLIMVLVVSGAAGLVLAALIGWWLGRRALQPLAGTLDVQRRFISDAGHELRTPVTLLHTRAQMLRRRIAKHGAAVDLLGDVLGDVDGVVADSGRLAEILEELLLAADPGVDRAPQPIELTALARDVVDAATAEAGARDVTLQGPPPGASPVQVAGLPVALRRAVTALVDNAVRHAGRAVTVSVERRERTAVIDVVDDGPGVAPEVVPHMFERFVAGRDATPSGRRSYGIGLALVNEIAVAHGGRVELLDRAEPGAALRITLPASRR